MIALKLVFQSLAGVGSVAAVAGGGYYVFNTVGNDFYLVSSPSTVSDSPTTELWVEKTKSTSSSNRVQTLTQKPVTLLESTTKTEKNYKCETGTGNTKQKDEDCYLYSLTIASTTDKSLNLKKIQEFITDNTKNVDVVKKAEAKADLKDHKFFLLKASSTLFSSWKLDGSETINLLSKTAETTNTQDHKSYGSLTVHAKITSLTIEGNADFAIATFLGSSTLNIAATTDGSTVKCKFKNSDNSTLKPCVISTFDNPSTNQTLKTLEFTGITLPTTQAAITSTTNTKYYLIQYTGTTKHSIIELNEKVIVVVQTPASAGTASNEGEFKVQTPVFIQKPATGTIKEAAIFS